MHTVTIPFTFAEQTVSDIPVLLSQNHSFFLLKNTTSALYDVSLPLFIQRCILYYIVYNSEHIYMCVCMNKNFERKKYSQWNLQKEKFHGFIIASDFMYGIRFVYVLVYKLSKTINKPRAIYEYNMLVLLIWWKRATILVWLLNLETEESEELNYCVRYKNKIIEKCLFTFLSQSTTVFTKMRKFLIFFGETSVK